MEFNKYKERGAYHWDEYKNQTIYGKHADRVKGWVRDGKTLDIGAGDGLITSLIGAEGIDDNETAIKLAKEKGVNVKFGSAYNLSDFEDESFDNVLMADVIEHLEFPEKCLKEIKRVLKKGGLLYITTPPAKSDGTLHDTKYHYREYTLEQLTNLLNSHFFVLEGKSFTENQRMYVVYKND